MQCNDACGEVVVATALQTSLLHHLEQLLLGRVHTNRFSEVLVTFLIAGDELADQRQDLKEYRSYAG